MSSSSGDVSPAKSKESVDPLNDPKKGTSNNQIFGWLLVAVVWIIVAVFIFMYVGVNSQLHTCNTSEAQTCYMFTCADGYDTATCGSYPYRCDDVEKGKVRCMSDPTKVVSIAAADGDLCGTDNYKRCKSTTGSV